MKKKIALLSIAVALIAITLIGGSLAWFSDTDEVKNVFTIGSVDIEQVEIFDKENAQLIPVVGDDPAVATDNYIQKNVTVENNGENDAYVQSYIAVPKVLDDRGILELYTGDLAAKGWSDLALVAVDVAIEGETVPYNVYLTRYESVLPAGETGNVTPACLEYVYISKTTDLNLYDNDTTTEGYELATFVDAEGNEVSGFNALNELNVYVATQGVQADGFAGAQAALTSAFANHPWEE